MSYQMEPKRYQFILSCLSFAFLECMEDNKWERLTSRAREYGKSRKVTFKEIEWVEDNSINSMVIQIMESES